MNRDQSVNKAATLKDSDLIEQMAFHEAGHAAAVYLRNKQINFPKVYFHIRLTGFNRAMSADRVALAQANCHAQLEGGLLIDNANLTAANSLSPLEISAYEADIVNLLVGPLAEAKYIAQKDGELINTRLMHIEALKNYGGKADLDKIDQYLGIICDGNSNKAEKLAALFSDAFRFIEQPEHWRAISHLAQRICVNEKELIHYQEAIAILDASVNQGPLYHPHGLGIAQH